MLRRSLIAALPILAVASAAQAAGGGSGKDKAPTAQHVDISPVALPVVVDGRVINYVFLEMRLNLSALANLAKLQEKEPYFRDALVRMGHRRPFTRKSDYLSLDEARLKSFMLAEAQRIGGKDVTGAEVMSQTPKRRTGVPQPPKA
jgi:hypothetical protein